MQRVIRPELLDSLPPDHPEALRNRRDLRIINRVMGNHRWIARTLSVRLSPGETAIEWGAGTGELGLRLARRGIASDGIDLWPRPANWPEARAWHRADLLAFDGYVRYAAVVGNLILHQFDDEALAALGRKLRDTRLIVACEPARGRIPLLWFRLLAPVFGAGRVTRHDAPASIEAGFRGRELPRALGLDPAGWDIRCHYSALGAYRMVARRR